MPDAKREGQITSKGAEKEKKPYLRPKIGRAHV
jgi:hypothetical protein